MIAKGKGRAIGMSCVVAALLLVGCGATSTPVATEKQTSSTAPPNQTLVSYGAQFLVTCTFSHASQDDPIVHPNEPGMAHDHEFFGNASTDAFSTFDSLVKDGSTCNDVGDRSAYWVPALLVDGKRQAPKRVDAYYRVAHGVMKENVTPYPDGIQILAGDQHSSTMPELTIVGWACGLSPRLSHEPPKDCTRDRPVQLRLTFPSCWDGKNLKSPDHMSHMAYPSEDRGCDPKHPVVLPQLTLVVHYSTEGSYTSAKLASGAFATAHGDFFSAWEPARIAEQTRGCLNRGVTCGIVGGTFHTGQGAGDNDYYNRSEAAEALTTATD